MSEVKVYSVYMATFSGHLNDTATLADPNGRYIEKSDYDSQSLTIRQQAEEIRLLRKELESRVSMTDEFPKLMIEDIYARIEAAKKAVK